MEFFIYFNLIIILPSIIFGFLLSKINNKTVDNLYKGSKGWIYTVCSFIGVPIHEISHAIFNIIFGHSIDKIVLFDPDGCEDGELGYVRFSYNTESLYQCIGLFFVGIAPIICGSCVILFIMRFLMPEVFSSLDFVSLDSLNIINIFANLYNTVIANVKNIFTNYDSVWQFLIFFVLTFSISINMDISEADLTNSKAGFVLIETILFVISIFLLLYKINVSVNAILYIASYMFSILAIELFFCILFLTVSCIIKTL